MLQSRVETGNFGSMPHPRVLCMDMQSDALSMSLEIVPIITEGKKIVCPYIVILVLFIMAPDA